VDLQLVLYQIQRALAKSGIIALTQSFETSLPYIPTVDGIKCLTLCPNGTDTQVIRDYAKIPI